jgi:hypothetical protein
MTLASVSSSEGNCLSKRKAEREESVVRSRGKGWCCNKSMSLECCKHDSDLRTTVGIQSRMGKGEETHLAEEFVVVREYALNQPESKRLAGVLELQELRTLSVTQQTEVLEDNNHVAGRRRDRAPVSFCLEELSI